MRDFETLRRFVQRVPVRLITSRYPGFKSGVLDGIEICGLGFGKTNWLCRLTYAVAANLRILFDSAQTIGVSPSIYAPVLLSLVRGRRIYFVMHHTVGAQSFRKYGPLGVVAYLSEQLFLRCGRRFLVSNRSLQDHIRRLNPKASVQLTANGIDPALLALESRPATPPFILFLGRFDVYMKGLDLLLTAFAESAAPLGINLVLAGRASEASLRKAKALVPENLQASVRMETGIDETRKRELLSTCLFFCSPSRFEGFGIAALEANAAGKAVLVTDTDGFRDSLALGETALAVPSEDCVALGRSMLCLIQNAWLRENLGRRGRERAKRFSWDAIAESEWTFLHNS